MRTAPPSTAIKPAALKPVSCAIAAAWALLLLDENEELVDLAVASVTLGSPVPPGEPLVVVTGQDVEHGIALVKGKLLTGLAEAKTGA